VKMSPEQLLKDSGTVDLWVVSAHRSALDRMRETSATLKRSGLFTCIDSFAGFDAFADHFIRNSWDEGARIYNKKNGISLLPGGLQLPADKYIDELGKKVAPLWSGELSSNTLNLAKGNYTLLLDCRGTRAKNALPEVNVR